MKWRLGSMAVMAMLMTGVRAAEPSAPVAESIKTILAVGTEGKGNPQAAQAWKSLVANSEGALFPVLEAFDTAKPTAANWLRSAIDGIIQAEEKAGRKPAVAELAKFVENTKRNKDARRIAFELLQTQDKAKASTLLTGLLNDPNPDLRRDAIAAELEKINKTTDDKGPTAALQKLFTLTRDVDQTEEIADLIGKVGTKPNLTKHFNFITQWQLVGPFDSTGGKAFQVSYDPEKKVDLQAELTGKQMAKLKWIDAQSEATYGTIDLNKALTKYKDAAAYAYAVVVSPTEQPAQIRVASQNAVQIFLNGKKIFEREEYHHGTQPDGHIADGMLKKGKNEILIKVMQNDQKEQWAQVWAFAARVCDTTGGKLELQQEIRDGDKTKLVPLGELKNTDKEEKK
jgi:hypothetical protein